MDVELTSGATEAPEPRLVLGSGAPSADAGRSWITRLRRVVSNHHGWFALLVYLLVAAIWDRSSIGHLGSVCACGLPGDPAQYAWSFVWFPHALFNGLSLLHTHAMWAPPGINLAGATATPLLAFLFAPITWIWGPLVSLDLAWIAAPVTAAWSAYWLCRYVTRARWASVVAGLAYGFGTYQVGQLNGHLHLVMIFCPPLVALTVLQFLNAAISRRRLVGQLLVLLLVQFGISIEVFFTMTVLGAVALALGWIFAGPDLRSRIHGAIVPICLAYAAVGLLMSWYILAVLHASAYAKDTGVLFPTDALSLLTPMIYTWVGGNAFSHVTSMYVAGPGETDLYTGLPMVAILVYQLARRWDRRASRWIASLLLITLLWVLGTHLYVAGQKTIWLPYSLFIHLPGFDQVLQGRVAIYWALICAVVLAIWLAGPSSHLVARWIVGLLAVVFVLPNLASPGAGNAASWTNPTFFSAGTYKHYLRQGENVLPIRWGWLSESPMWQAETHMYFNLASGYFTTSIPPGWESRSPMTSGPTHRT